MAARAAEAIVQALFRARGFILIALVVAFAVALIEIFRQGFAELDVVLRVAIVLAGVCVIVFIHIRHFWLTVLATLAPLPGLIFVLAVAGTPIGIVADYVLALIVALFAADEFAVRTAEGAPCQTAAIAAMNVLASAFLAVVATMAMLFAGHWMMGEAIWFEIGGVAAALMALLIVLLFASYLAPNESAISGFNRMRELERRLTTPLLSVARPRWGASVAGIAAVLCALGYFGASNVGPLVSFGWRWALFAAVVVCGTSLWTVSDWRRAVAITLSLAPPALLALWAIARRHGAFFEPLRARFEIVSLCGFALILFAAALAGDYFRNDKNMAMASSMAMERKAGVIVSATAASVLVLATGAPMPAPLIVSVIASAFAAILFQPAAAISLESLFPRREAIDSRYRVR